MLLHVKKKIYWHLNIKFYTNFCEVFFNNVNKWPRSNFINLKGDWPHSFTLAIWLADREARCSGEREAEPWCSLLYESDQSLKSDVNTEATWGKKPHNIWATMRQAVLFMDRLSPPARRTRLLLGIFFSLHQYVCGKMLHCFMLALWPRTPRGRRAPSFILLRVNCCDRTLRGPSLALCPLRSKEAALILSVLLNLATQTRL